MRCMKYQKAKMTACCGLVLGMAIFISSCGDVSKNVTEVTEQVPTEEVMEEEMDDREIAALSKVSLQLLKETVLSETEDPNKNILISPNSIITALAMTENGAAGDTLLSMQEVISGGIPVDQLNPLLYTFNQRMQDSKDVSFHIADSIWVKDDGRVKLDETFAGKAKSYYDADVFLAPFDNTTTEDINSWVNKNTNEMIPSVIDHISEDARVFLINAMAFEGKWEEEYQKESIEENSDFTNAEGEVENVTMLHSEEPYYMELNGGTGFVKYYKGCDYAFVGILPPEGVSNAEYVEGLGTEGQDFAQAFQDRKSDCEVIVTMPEFSYDYDTELSDVLGKLGMGVAFGGNADFSAMVTEDSEPIRIDSVIHKTHIEVDREGTKAAAVTAVIMEATGAMPMETKILNIRLDRPFVYGIVDVTTGLPIFIGCVNSVNGE